MKAARFLGSDALQGELLKVDVFASDESERERKNHERSDATPERIAGSTPERPRDQTGDPKGKQQRQADPKPAHGVRQRSLEGSMGKLAGQFESGLGSGSGTAIASVLSTGVGLRRAEIRESRSP